MALPQLHVVVLSDCGLPVVEQLDHVLLPLFLPDTEQRSVVEVLSDHPADSEFNSRRALPFFLFLLFLHFPFFQFVDHGRVGYFHSIFDLIIYLFEIIAKKEPHNSLLVMLAAVNP